MASHKNRNTYKLLVINGNPHLFSHKYLMPLYFNNQVALLNMVYNIITKYVKTYLSLNKGSIKYKFAYMYTGLTTGYTYNAATKTYTLTLNATRVNNPHHVRG